MARIISFALLCLVFAVVAGAEEYTPKTGDRVDWGKVFGTKGVLERQEDFSQVIERRNPENSMEWRGQPEEAEAVKETPVERRKEPSPDGGEALAQDKPEIRYRIGGGGPAALPASTESVEPAASSEAEDTALAPEETPKTEIQEPAKKPERVAKALPDRVDMQKPAAEPALPGKEKPHAPGPRVASIVPGPAPEKKSDPKPQRLYGEDTISHFLTLAFFHRDDQLEYKRGGAKPKAKVLTKWEDDLKVAAKGVASESELSMLYGVVEEMNRALSSVSDLSVGMAEEAANVRVFFLPSRKGEDMSGYVKNAYDGPRIVGSDVVFYSGKANRADMLRQFMHVLGFMGLREDGQGSIMLTKSGENPYANLPEMDKRALMILYRSGFEPGMQVNEAERILTDAYTY